MGRGNECLAVVCVALAVGSCRELAPAAGPLEAAAVAACYRLADAADRPLGPSAFWSAPLRLSPKRALLDGDGGYRSEPGVYTVEPTAVIPPEQAIDTGLFRATWRILPPDTVLVLRGTGFAGVALELRPSGADLVGTHSPYSDVIDPDGRPPAGPVHGQRVPCPGI